MATIGLMILGPVGQHSLDDSARQVGQIEGSGNRYTSTVGADMAKWGKLIEDAGIRAD